MEGTTVFPSPVSPTEGDYLCETDATNVAMHSVTLLICLCGLAGNGAVIGLLNLKNCNSGIFDLAVSDFLFLLFTVLSALLFLVEDMSCTHIMPMLHLSFLFRMSVVSYYWGLFRLIRSITVLYVRNLFQLCCPYDLPERMWLVVGSVQSCAFFALFAVIPAVTFLCPSHEQEHCRAPLISMYAIILLFFVAPVVISSTIDLIKAKWGSQQQQPKRRDIVIILTLLLPPLRSLCHFLQQLGYIAVSSQVVFLLTCINSSIKPFIYFLAGRCMRPCSRTSRWRLCTVGSLRLSLQRVFEEQKEKTDHSDDDTRDTGF
ncbi:mas-related G-protein coupled receptor member H-like [Onychostruthus taczanowskii]|uniref:mas-related G-protein coupled receptor member H-like n=1 Tax=Onychostruthus taczanowskii TaxID=356909 RepID=UPI001B802F84|nr:mas-related G-protein coupled receptor member H-like [Onychostruthus taczanowskii]